MDKYDGQRVDLLALIPPNRLDDLNLPNREQQVAGLTLRADRVIMDRERYSDCERMTQHKLSDDIQASCREQGHVISVKEWADKNQHRGTLRLRLRCRSSACRFQFQLNWDSKAGFWYISRRRCGTFSHTCQPVQAGAAKVSKTAGKRWRLAPEEQSKGPSSNKRAKTIQEGNKNKNTTSKQDQKPQGAPESAVLDALDSARSLLDLSRAPSSPIPPASPSSDGENQKPTQKASPVPVVAAPNSMPPDFVRLGDRLFMPQVSAAAAGMRPAMPMLAPQQAALAMQHKLALLRGHQARMDAAAIRSLQRRCMALAPSPAAPQGATLLHHHQDPRLLRQGLLLNGGSFANI